MAQEHDCTCFPVKGDDLKKEISTVGKPRFEYDYPPPAPPRTSTWKPQHVLPLDHEMSDEQMWRYVGASRGGTVSIDTVRDKIPIIRKYFQQLHESDGFDIDQVPSVRLHPGAIVKYSSCRKCHPEDYDKYMNLAQWGIDETYNKDNKKEFKVLEVNSVNGTWCVTEYYLMTVTAAEDVDKAGGSDPACKRTFQVGVAYSKPGYWNNGKEYRDVDKCRLKF